MDRHRQWQYPFGLKGQGVKKKGQGVKKQDFGIVSQEQTPHFWNMFLKFRSIWRIWKYIAKAINESNSTENGTTYLECWVVVFAPSWQDVREVGVRAQPGRGVRLGLLVVESELDVNVTETVAFQQIHGDQDLWVNDTG